MKLWIVTAVDHDADGNCDGKARVLGAFKSYDEAKNYVNEDISDWVDRNCEFTLNSEEGVECDFDKMVAWYAYDDSDRCEWNIEEIEVE